MALVLFLVLAAGVLEIALRLTWKPLEYISVYAPDPTFHHRARPNAIGGEMLETGRGVNLRTNSLGLRGEQIGAKRPGACRIVDVGDSFIEAGTSPEPETSAKVLERLLNERVGGREFEVINAGQVSYSPILYYLLIQRVLLPLAPDLVLVNVDMSDVQDDYVYSLIAEFDAAGRPLRVPNRVIPAMIPRPIPPPRWLAWLTRRSVLLQWVEYRTQRTFGAPREPAMPGDIRLDRVGATRDSGVAWEEHYRRTGKYLHDIRDLLAARGVPLAIFVYPMGHQVAAREWDPGRRAWGFAPGRVYTGTFFPFLDRYCRQTGLPCHLLLDRFREYRGKEVLYLPRNGHFTAAGQRLLAEAQFEVLTRDGILARACSAASGAGIGNANGAK